MKEIFVIDEIDTRESTRGPGLRVVLIPQKDVYVKNVKLVFSGENVMQVLENFDIPSSVGDTVELDLKPKQTQTKLVKK